MAAHHHHAAAPAAHSFCYSSCCSSSSACTSCHRCYLPPHLSSDLHHPPHPPHPVPDLHHHHPHPPHPVPDLHHHHPPPPHLVSDVYHHPPPSPYLDSSITHLPGSRHHNDYLQSLYFLEGTQTQPTISGLLRRIAALESTIRRRTTSPQILSLRDAAARTIQTHFRTFLLRRSRTLGQLKQLASIKSNLGILKSSVSETPHFDFNAVYHNSLILQRRLDIIQGHDPLIKKGKIALKLELLEFLNFLDRVSADDILQSTENNLLMKSHERKARTVNSKGLNIEKLRTSVLAKQQDGIKLTSRKNVSFKDNVMIHSFDPVSEDTSIMGEIRVFANEEERYLDSVV